MNIPELIKEAKKGKLASEKWLYDLHANRLQMVCRRYVKNEQDAEECMHDGYYKFFKSLESFEYKGEAALYQWLKRIVINECLMFIRKGNVFNMVPETAAEDIPIEEKAINNLSASELMKMILLLPEGYRTVFNLSVVEGMTHPEIAELLGIQEGSSKSQLSRAKVLLQKMLIAKGIDYGKRNEQQ